MSILQLKSKSDWLGISASMLCMIHCIVTPFLFVAHAEMLNHHHHDHAHPEWWGFIEILFLVISFVAVWWSSKTSSKKWIPYLLWINWVLLAGIVLNERFEWFSIVHELVYIPAFALVILHFLNTQHSSSKKSIT